MSSAENRRFEVSPRLDFKVLIAAVDLRLSQRPRDVALFRDQVLDAVDLDLKTHQLVAARASTIFFASAMTVSLSTFSRVDGLSRNAKLEPGG